MASSNAARRSANGSFMVWHSSSLARSFPAISVFEPHDVIELRRRDFYDVHVGNRRHPMHGPRGTVKRVSRLHPQDFDIGTLTHFEVHFSGLDEKCLVLFDV